MTIKKGSIILLAGETKDLWINPCLLDHDGKMYEVVYAHDVVGGIAVKVLKIL